MREGAGRVSGPGDEEPSFERTRGTFPGRGKQAGRARIPLLAALFATLFAAAPRDLAAQSEILYSDRFEGPLRSEWRMDIPCLGSGGTPPHAYVNIVNGRLMTWCQFFSHDMWDARNCAPILWIPAPGGDYFVDTRVSLAGLGDPQVAGIVVYDGPDGANGAVTLGLDTYENSGTVTVAALQRVGDHNFDRFSPALSLPNGWLDLRLLRQGNTFTAWYSEVGGDVWKILGSLDYAGSAARVGLFLKNGGPGHDEAYFNWFTLWRNTAPPSPSSGWPSLFSPQFDGRKDSLSFDWVPNAGPLTLYGVSASGGRLAAVERGEGILYVAGKLGVKYGLRSIIVGTDSFQATASIEIPPILGGYQADIDVRYTKERGWEGDGFYLSIPGVVEKDAFSMEKVFLEVRPSKGSYGGGGLFGIGRVGKRYGGWVTVDATLGSNGDVTLFGLGEGNLNQPIGDTGAFLQEVDGKIVNSSGLSSATNWGGSTLLGHIEFSAGPRLDIPVGGPWFVLSAKGDLRWNIHDSSFTVDGTGTLLKHFDLASVHGTYTPTANVDVTARFSDPTGIYSGSANLHASGSSFTGSLSGDLRIPGAVPVVGGLGIGNVSASLDGTSLKGHGSVDVAHGTRQVCHDVCNSACSWIPFVGDICRSVCNSVCDWVPNFFGVPFDFELDPSSGSFTFHPHPPFRKVPILVASAGDGTATLDVPAGAPAAFFRAAYTAPGVTRVDLTLSTPSGEVLRSADGPLPAGFRTVSGFSRFNPDAREQVIALADPAPGRYSVSVADVERLGGVTVELILPRHFRSLDVTSLAPVDGKGKYSVSWRAEDPDGIRRVRVFLARDRLVPSGPLAADVAVDGALSHASSVTIDTSLATVGAGWYWLVLEAEDSTGATLKKVSDEPVLVSPASAPLPPASLAASSGDGSVNLSWTPSPTGGVRGSRVLWSRSHVRLGSFEGSAFVPAGTSAFTIAPLANGEPLLVTVVAVGADFSSSVPADVLRVVPASPGENAPEITSEPDVDATAGVPYYYLPYFRSRDDSSHYAWSLEAAPDGMTIDPAGGLVAWVPSPSQAGRHEVRLRLGHADGTSASSTVQEYSLYVYAPDLASGMAKHPCRFERRLLLDAFAGSLFIDHVAISGAGCDVEHVLRQPREARLPDDPAEPPSPVTGAPSFRLLAGPQGMRVNPVTGVVRWPVPAGATGHSVSIGVTLESGHQMRHDYYLAVSPARSDGPRSCRE